MWPIRTPQGDRYEMQPLILSCLFLIFIQLSTSQSNISNADCNWMANNPPSTCSPYLAGQRPPLLLISLGGFRPEYLTRAQTGKKGRMLAAPTINCLAQKGVSAPYMMPSYPTQTYPNLYSLVTGKYPESHGLVANEFYDPEINATFTPQSTNASDPRWWKGGEPIWLTVKKQGKISACDSWPGPKYENETLSPTYQPNNRGKRSSKDRVDQVLNWLEMPQNKRPNVIALYLDEADINSRIQGPESPLIFDKIKAVDDRIRHLMDGLAKKNVSHCVDIIIVSDRGMAGSTVNSVINLDRLAPNLNKRAAVQYGSPSIIRPINWAETYDLRNKLDCDPHMTVRIKDELPHRMHYCRSHRIGNLVLDSDLGWKTYFRHSGAVAKGGDGWDNLYLETQAIFLAYGPSFKKQLKTEAFENVQLYDLMCTMLQVAPGWNDGVPGALHHLLTNPPPLITPTPIAKPPTLSYPGNETFYNFNMANRKCGLFNDSINRWDQDVYMNMSTETEGRLLKNHAPLGTPVVSNSTNNSTGLLINRDYLTGFDFYLGMARWTEYSLHHISDNEERHQWRLDPRLNVSLNGSCDRLALRWDRNRYRYLLHLFPKAFASRMDDTWLDTNMLEVSDRTGQLLEKFQELVSRVWIQRRPINVIIGPSKTLNDIFVIATSCKNMSVTNLSTCPITLLDVQGFLLPRAWQSDAYSKMGDTALIADHVATLHDIERATGLLFFTNLPRGDKIALLTRTTLESHLIINPTRFPTN